MELTKNPWKNDRFSVFIVEPWHLLHLSISKKLEECAVRCIAATEKDFASASNKKQGRPVFNKTLLLQACSDLISAYQKRFFLPRLQVDFSTPQQSLPLNGPFKATDLKGLLERKKYSAVVIAFLIKDAILDRVTGSTNKPVLTSIHLLPANIVNQLLYCISNFEEKRCTDSKRRDKIQQLKELSRDLNGALQDIDITLSDCRRSFPLWKSSFPG